MQKGDRDTDFSVRVVWVREEKIKRWQTATRPFELLQPHKRLMNENAIQAAETERNACNVFTHAVNEKD